MTEEEKEQMYYEMAMHDMGYTTEEAINMQNGLTKEGNIPEPELPF